MKSYEEDVVIESFAKHPLVRNENLTDEKRQKLAEICEKLGFNPSTEYPHQSSGTEDDTKESLFAVLTDEELDFLLDNGYLDR
jgi:hypothetical protein